jgi:hypothetical protein
MEAPTLKERTSAARQVVADIAIDIPELQALPKGKYTQAANQMAKSAARGEQFDPVDVVYNVAGIERPAPVAPAPAPEVPAAPSIDEVAVAPVKAAIETAAAPAPVVPGAVPSLAQASAREVGITPAPTVEPAPPAPSATITPEAAPAAPLVTPTKQDFRNTEQALRAAIKADPRKPAPSTPQLKAMVSRLVNEGRATPEGFQAELDTFLEANPMQVGKGAVRTETVAPAVEPAPVEAAPVEAAPVEAAPEVVSEPEAVPTLYHGGRSGLTLDDIDIIREPGATKQGKKGRVYGGFYATANPEEAQGYADMAGEGNTVYEVNLKPDAVVEQKEGDITRLTPAQISDYRARGVDVVVGKDVRGRTEHVVINKDAVTSLQDMAAPAAPTPEAAAPPGAPPVPPPPPAATGGPGGPAPEDGGTEPLTTADVDAVVSVRLTKAQIKQLEEAAGIRRMRLNAMQKRIAQSRNPEETLSLAGKLMLIARNPDTNVNVLTSLFNSIPPSSLSLILSFAQTDDVVRLAERAGMANIGRVDAMVRDEYVPYIHRLMNRASRLAEEWAEFTGNSPEGADAMADVMFFSNMVDADPSLAPNANAYLKLDPTYQDLTTRYQSETDPKKKSNLKGEVTKRRGEIQRLYSGGADTDPSGNPIIVKGWNDVPPKGKQIFRKARDHYRQDFDEHYRLLMQRIDDAGFKPERAAQLKESVDKMFADANKRMVYFPMKRFGEYWVSIGKGASGEFHMFESFVSQQAFITRRRLSGDTRPVSSGFGRGSLRKLRGEVSDISDALKGVLDLIDTGTATDPELLRDGVFQLYLSALPEADMRRRFIHRQFKTGFSTDMLRTFATTAIASANQLGRLAYNGKFKNLIDQSYAETEGNPAKPRLDALTDEMDRRLTATLSGDADTFFTRAANGFAKGTFLWLLSSVKSAFMNLTQLHFTGFPVLTAEFGEVATTAMAARYTGQLLTGQRIAYAVRDEEGNVKLNAPKFTAQSSAYIRGLQETDPDRYEAMQRAWLYGEEREVTQSTFTSAQNIYEITNKPAGELGFTQAVRAGDKAQATKQAIGNTIDGIGGMFHHSERIGREIMYMSAFELAYDRNLKQGMDSEAAADAAMALAVKLTNNGMFDFSNWNKPRAFKTPVGRVALQMRGYSFQMTSLLLRSGFNLIAAQRTKGKRLAAARVFFGVAGMTTLYGGLRANQFFLFGMGAYGIYKFFESLMEDDDEEDEVTAEDIERNYMKFADEQGRELTKKDMDYFIRTVWIPETFGPGSGIQDVLGLSDENATKLARVADIGLPALAGVDISNSVALTNLWHPVETKSDNAEAASFEALGRAVIGPSGSFITAWNKTVEEANKGNYGRAIEATLPAIVRNYVKSERLQEEGLRVGKDQDIILRDPSFYDTYTSTMQALGFPEAETSRAMQLDIAAGDIEREVAQERTDLLDKRYQVILDMVNNPSEDVDRQFRAIERDIQIYSLNYPSNAIDEDTKQRSFEQKQAEAAERMYGLGLNPKIPVRQPLVEERAAELGQ